MSDNANDGPAMTLESLLADDVQRDFARIVRELREAADNVERIAASRLSSRRAPHTERAQDAQRVLDVMAANTPMRKLVQAASEADVARALGQ